MKIKQVDFVPTRVCQLEVHCTCSCHFHTFNTTSGVDTSDIQDLLVIIHEGQGVLLID